MLLGKNRTLKAADSAFFLSTLQQQDDINGQVKRPTTLAIWTVPVVALAATAISSSRAIAARPSESTFSANDDLGQIDISAAAMGHVIRKFNTAL